MGNASVRICICHTFPHLLRVGGTVEAGHIETSDVHTSVSNAGVRLGTTEYICIELMHLHSHHHLYTARLRLRLCRGSRDSGRMAGPIQNKQRAESTRDLRLRKLDCPPPSICLAMLAA